MGNGQYYQQGYFTGSPFVIHSGYATTDIFIPNNAVTGLWDFGLYYWGFYNPTTPQLTVLAPGANTARVTGSVKADLSNNCPSGQLRANQEVSFNPGGYVARTDAFGSFSIWLPLGTYTVEALPASAHQTMVCPAIPYSLTLSSNWAVYGNNDFLMQEQNVNDLDVNLIANFYRPGFSTSSYVTLRNTGPLAANNVQLKIYIDPLLVFSSSAPSGTFAQDTLTVNLGTVQGNSTQNIIFETMTPIANTFGMPLRFGAWASSSNADFDLTNNSDSITVIVSGSYDPNDKQVWTQDNVNADGSIMPGDSMLRYLVRFQNTGTDTAFNIFILDTLDANLDPSSLKVLSGSHGYAATFKSNNVVEFAFNNVLLPDSNTNEALSHGHIEFSLKLKPNRPLGTEIPNSASIYFDFNQPVLTNTVTSRICPEFNLGFSYQINGNTVTFSNQSTGTLSAFDWDFGDNNNSSMASPSHTYTTSGIYLVCLNMTDTCGLHTICDSVDFTLMSNGTAEYLSESLLLYPNPNRGKFSLEVMLPEAGQLIWKITDLQGKVLHETSEISSNGIWKKEIDVQNLPAGSYFLQLDLNGSSVNRMFSVQ
jgi:uncharacterized repeat protein (TIGR01451 family)